MPLSYRTFAALVFSLTALLFAQDNAPPPPASNSEPEGLLRIDVLVTDQAGHPVAGLKRTDFSLLENGQPRSIITFRASPATTRLNPPESVILFIDTLNLPENIAAFEREQVEKFLRQNSGRLDQPVTIYSLNDMGLFRNCG